MKIDELIERLQEVKRTEGNIEVTTTGSLQADGDGPMGTDAFETTVENLQVGTWKIGVGQDAKILGQRVRLIM